MTDTIDFIYKRDDTGEVQRYPFPADDPITHPPVGAVLFTQGGVRWTCTGRADDEKEAD